MHDPHSRSIDESEEHDGRFVGGETVRRSWVHVEPKARSRVELFAIHDEVEPAFQDLDDRRSRCLVFAQALSDVEAETVTSIRSSRRITRDTTVPV